MIWYDIYECLKLLFEYQDIFILNWAYIKHPQNMMYNELVLPLTILRQ